MWIPPAYSPIRPMDLLKALFSRESSIPELEGRLVGWYEAERALATGSGTQALQLAIRTALDSAGAEGPVALPAYNCFDVVSAAVWVGAPVVFYDIDPKTLSPEPESLEGAVRESAVLVVANLYGFPLDWDLIRGLTEDRGIPVVEDAAQGLGATWKGKPAGTFGDLSVLSFGRGKGWTGGSGGAVLARRGFGANLPSRLGPNPQSRIAQAAKLVAIWILAHPLVYGIPARIPALGLGETPFHPPQEPKRIHSFSAEVVLLGRDAAMAEVITRQSRGRCFRTASRASSRPINLPAPVPGGISGELRVPFLGGGILEEAPKLGVYRGYPKALPDLGVERGLAGAVAANPGAHRLVAELLTSPSHSRAPEGDTVWARAMGGTPNL